ncbi:Protein of unknown function (DUF2418) domain containing protein [Rhypophila decipiens]
MAPTRPTRLVRKRPFMERFQPWLNPLDLYLWVSEEIQTFDWDSKNFGTRFGLAANFIFFIARANSAKREDIDDVFSDSPSNGWVSYLVNLVTWVLVGASVLNAWHTFSSSRHYRLFEANVESDGPATPSAHRVRVDSSPTVSTPLRFVQDLLSKESAESRAHPDKTRDVWEISVWNPYPATVRIFCLFSPGHVLIHWLFLPLNGMDPRPSVTVFKCLVLQILLSVQLLLLQTSFSQQARDQAIIQKEVLHEYDTKYVHPRLHPVVREIGTQISIDDSGNIEEETVAIGTPTTLLRRGFQTHPNPNYAKLIDPDAGRIAQPQFTPRQSLPAQPQHQQLQQSSSQARNVMSPSLFSSAKPRVSDVSSFLGTQPSSQVSRPSGLSRQSLPPQFHQPSATPPRQSGLGGSLGVYSHVNSPLKKATSMGDIKENTYGSPRNSREMAALEQREIAERIIRQSSPLKGEVGRRATSSAFESTGTMTARNPADYMHSPDRLAHMRAGRWTQERFPSRRV